MGFMKQMQYKWDPQLLKRLQETELGLLKLFDKVCTKNNISYFALFGTAIGAIRHKGFIPWDDDIDVGIMYDDYEKLKKLPKEEWGDDVLFVTPEDDVPYHRAMICRLYKKGTIFQNVKNTRYDRPRKNESSLRPIWMCIFIYNRIDSVDISNKICKKAIRLQRMYFYSKVGMHIKNDDCFNEKIKCLRNDLAHRMMNIVSKPELKIFSIFLKIIRQLNHGPYVTTFLGERHTIFKSVSKEQDMFPVIRVPFEDMQICIQKNYDEMLTSLYGDYMALPPEDKRYCHGAAILDFGDGKGNVLLHSGPSF